jgi:dimethylaniline monooxygenase (N-oxide forming)
MDTRRIETVGIIGAGVAGLATARELIALGKECTVFERSSSLGGVWSDGYLNFGVQVQKELYEFPDWPLPKETPNFTPGPIMHKYLNDFADHFGVFSHIRFDTVVKNIAEMDGPASGWVVTSIHDNQEKHDQFDLVIVCIGLYSNVPNIPSFPNRDGFGGEVIHNSKLKSPEQLKGKRVAVVGYGKSATDAAIESAEHAEEAHIVFREPHWPIPQKLAGILPFKWGLLHRMNSTLIPLYQHATPVEKMVHGAGKPLVWFYWRLVETLLYFQCKLGSRFGTRVSLVPKDPIEIGAFSESTMVPRGSFYRLARNDEIQLHRTTIEEFTPTGLKLADGEHLELDLVILATGWETDFSFIEHSVWQRFGAEDDGFYLYRHILNPDVPDLFFVGRASSISSILTYCLQAHWIAKVIKGKMMLPKADDMKRNIEEMKAWKRSWIPFSPARSARLIAHTQHYHDELLNDLRINPLRKTGVLAPLKELIAPYESRDYAAVISRH